MSYSQDQLKEARRLIAERKLQILAEEEYRATDTAARSGLEADVEALAQKMAEKEAVRSALEAATTVEAEERI